MCRERDRLRDARGFFSRPLGPLPASAGISTALVTTLGTNLDRAWVLIALSGLVVLVALGIWYDGKPAYRQLYARELVGVRSVTGRRNRRREQRAAPSDPESLVEWYETMLERDEAIVGTGHLENRWRWPWERVETLQDGVDSERTGLRLIQFMWVCVIASLVLAALL